MPPSTLSRETKRKRAKALAAAFGVTIADVPVCEGHVDPLTFFSEWIYDRPPVSLVHGPRGSGKSYLRSLASHIDSNQHNRHKTKILGGSEAQSAQIFEGIKTFTDVRFKDADLCPALTATKAKYPTGSELAFIPASEKSVRGPHVHTLCLDEVDEIEPSIRESAVGMAMSMFGITAQISMTSTWHRTSGPMSELIQQGRDGRFPVHTFCTFEVLERCPEWRSGPNLEHCDECPLKKWCHSDMGSHPSGLPKAKRSNGHYTIDSFIQKVNVLSERVLESDFLCLRPKSYGTWFKDFDRNLDVGTDAEYDFRGGFHCATDPGVHCGAVWFQIKPTLNGSIAQVNVFGDYYCDEKIASQNAAATCKKTFELTRVPIGAGRFSMDPAANARNAVGPVVRAEYESAGCVGRNGIEHWPVMGHYRPKADTLALLEALIKSADGHRRIRIHPRCTKLIEAFESYSRASIRGQLMDWPTDPQHPYEEMIDSFVGGLLLEHPEGRRGKSALERNKRHAGSII